MQAPKEKRWLFRNGFFQDMTFQALTFLMKPSESQHVSTITWRQRLVLVVRTGSQDLHRTIIISRLVTASSPQ